MIKNASAVLAAAVLLGACSTPEPMRPPVMATATTTAPQSQNFMVFFDWDSSRLTDTSASVISQAAAAYKSRGSANITTTGNTDTSGPDGYNMALSLRRANVVKDALVRQGVPATAITVIGKGESVLLVQTADGVREPQNRRVEIAFAGATATTTSVFSDPRSYCKALSDKWRQYRTSQVDTVEAAAIAQCEAGNYAGGIPTLEDALITARVPLPAPGYRWPGRPI